MKIVKTELVDVDCHHWLSVTFDEMAEPVDFTMMSDFSLYVLDTDGSAMTDSESDFIREYYDADWIDDMLAKLNTIALSHVKSDSIMLSFKVEKRFPDMRDNISETWEDYLARNEEVMLDNDVSFLKDAIQQWHELANK